MLSCQQVLMLENLINNVKLQFNIKKQKNKMTKMERFKMLFSRIQIKEQQKKKKRMKMKMKLNRIKKMKKHLK